MSDTLFAAELRPHRSASPKGLMIVIAFMAGVCFAIGLAFMVIGAWPVVGFLGLDVVLLYAALRLNHGHGQLAEWVTLTPDRLEVVRRDAWGRLRTFELDPKGLLVVVEPGDSGVDEIALRKGRDVLLIGGYLPPMDRPLFARSLRQALARVPLRSARLQPTAARCAPCAPASYQ